MGFYQVFMYQKASRDLVSAIIIEENNTVRSIYDTPSGKPACYPSSEWILYQGEIQSELEPGTDTRG